MTIFERLSIQMEAVVPLVRELEAVLGEEVVHRALEERLRRQVAKARATPAASVDMRRFADGAAAYAEGGALDYEVLASDDERFEMDVTRCEYAAMMERLGARDIGHLLVCGPDFAMAERLGLELTRTQTCMQGASHCDFRYRKRQVDREA